MDLQSWREDIDGELNADNLRAKLAVGGYAVAMYTYPPGTHFGNHIHAGDKKDGVLSGEFLMEIQGEKVLLRAGDILHVPAGVVHSARVVGEEPVVSLDATKL
ncbi:MAG: cupin domain-containing protein [Pseudomonadales bacterium]|nr:cupin domain-containing protein [Pseudomonadales bacterium]NIX07069.1 cupin domain-containing protein [Pseudomonadales bacterium]